MLKRFLRSDETLWTAKCEVGLKEGNVVVTCSWYFVSRNSRKSHAFSPAKSPGEVLRKDSSPFRCSSPNTESIDLRMLPSFVCVRLVN